MTGAKTEIKETPHPSAPPAIRDLESFAQLLFCHREERKRRGDLFKYKQLMRLLRYARNDRCVFCKRFTYRLLFHGHFDIIFKPKTKGDKSEIFPFSPKEPY